MRIGSAEWKACIGAGADRLGVSLTPQMIDAMALYGEELIRWNRRINLTAITDPLAVAVKHFIDSTAAAPYIPLHARLLDIGAGAGFPGLVLKIIRPDLAVTLVDSVRKKVSFQQQVIRILGLSGIQARHGRAEEMADTDTGGYDVVICRALGDLGRFHRLSRPLLAAGGRCIAMKGRPEEVEAELAEVSTDPGGEIGWQRVPYTLPYLDAPRTLAIHSASNSGRE
jgi:16S rRNA (guanine527-N7)-methyltransferase